MTESSDEVNAIITGKAGIRHAGEAMDAMRAVASAHKKRSLKDFEAATSTYAKHLQEDPLVRHHLATLYDVLLQSNICRIIEPFSRRALLAAAARAPLATLRAIRRGVRRPRREQTGASARRPWLFARARTHAQRMSLRRVPARVSRCLAPARCSRARPSRRAGWRSRTSRR